MAAHRLLGQSLRRLALTPSTSTFVAPATTMRLFSTSTPMPAQVKKKAVPMKRKISAVKKTTRGARGSTHKRPASDHSVSLSKTNEYVVDVPDMSHLPLLHAENVTLDSVAQTYAYTDKALSVFKEFGLPLTVERELALHPRPRTLLREQSLEMFKLLDSVKNGNTSQSLLLHGKGGSGKSVLMAQSIAHAAEEGWIIISVPQAIDLINSSTLFTYSPQHLAYLQPEATKSLLEAIGKVNREALKQIQIFSEIALDDTTVKVGTGLDAVIRLAVNPSTSPASTQTLFESVIMAIVSQTTKPVLVAVDDVQALFRLSKYVNPDCQRIQSYELGLPRALLPLFTKHEKFRLQRGVLMGAISTSRTEYIAPPELETALAQSRNVKLATEAINPYTRMDDIHLQHAQSAIQDTQLIDTSVPLTKSEAAALLAQLKKENVHWSAINDEFFLAKLIETNGNPRWFSRSLTSTLL